jgi:RNA polymerase sigma-70 factor (ECF subfamily)
MMRIVDELPYEEIAEELGISEQTVRARVSRGLRALADALEHDRGSIA